MGHLYTGNIDKFFPIQKYTGLLDRKNSQSSDKQMGNASTEYVYRELVSSDSNYFLPPPTQIRMMEGGNQQEVVDVNSEFHGMLNS